MQDDDITAGWFKFVADANKDSGYPHSHAAVTERSALEERWKRECAGLEVPEVLWSNESGRYEIRGLSVPKGPLNTGSNKGNG